MRGKLRSTVTVLILLAALVLGTLSVYAADVKQGWVTEDGVSRYYENGRYVTGQKKIGPHTYIFSNDGTYIGVTDGHKPIGNAGTMDTAEYKAALADRQVLSHLTLNKNETVVWVNKETPELLTSPGEPYYNIYHYYQQKGTKDGSYLLVAAKKSNGWIEDRGNGNYAVAYEDSAEASNSDAYLNLNITKDTSLNPKGSEVIIDFDIKVGEDFGYNNTVPLIQNIYRQAVKHDGTIATAFNTILVLKADGCIYAKALSTTQYLCKLVTNEYTRISVAINHKEDVFAFYVNGILVKDGIKFNSLANFDLTDQQMTEIRFTQFNTDSDYEGSLYYDNISVYLGKEPVCVDKETPARNGVYEEGSYLRIYENNIMLSGYQYVTGTFFGQTFNDQQVLFSSGKAFIGNRATVKNGSEIISNDIVDGNKFKFPNAVTVKGKSFIAWKVTEEGGKSYLAYPGDIRMLASNITVEAVGVEFAMLEGASIKKDEDTYLRYVAKISKSDYDMLSSAGANFETHILIAPTSYYDNLYGYHTLEALKSSGCDMSKVSDVKVNGWFKETDGYYYFTANTSVIDKSKYTEKYSAIAYISVKNGNSEVVLYSDYSDEENSRSVYEVAVAAYNDRVTEKGVEGYKTKIKYSGVATYSSYSKGENKSIKKIVDTIVTLDVNSNGFSDGGKYYELPYDIDAPMDGTKYNVKVSGKLGEVYGLSVNGELLPTSKYTKTDSAISFTFDPGYQELWTGDVEEGKYWYIVDTSSAEGFTEANTAFPEEDPTGATAGVLWDYNVNASVVISNNPFGYDPDTVDYRYFQYYDSESGKNVWNMSDWQTLSFSVYLDKKFDKATFYMLFYSENDALEGSDYYLKLITVYSGWNNVSFTKESLSSSRTPLGWDKITSVKLLSTGWSQTNTGNEKLYFTNFEAYEHEIKLNNAAIYPELSNSAAFAIGGYGGIVNNTHYFSNPYDKDTKAFKEGDIYYLPANVMAVEYDANAIYFKGIGELEFEYNGKLYNMTAGKSYKVDGERVKLIHPAKVSGGAVYISAEDMMQIFGYSEIYTDIMGLVVLSNTKNIFDHTSDYDKISDIINECIYVRPTGEQIVSDVMDYSGAQHPYLMLNQNDFNSLNYYKKVDATLQKYIKQLDESHGVGSSNYNSTPVNYHITDGIRLLDIARKAMGRIIPWATLYKLYEKDNPQEADMIATRIWEELEAINQFRDWNPSHYLDIGELAYPVAIAYDWLYDHWNNEQRGIIEGMLYGFALKTTTALGGSYNLAAATNNWNGVTNGGIMIAALALVNVKNDVTWKANSTANPGHGETPITVKELLDTDGSGADSIKLTDVVKYTTSNKDFIEDVMAVLENCILAIEKGMWVYGPDGGYEEGPGYWSYGTIYTHIFISALDSACGRNYGVYEAPGFANSVYFTTYLGSMNTTWGFHDGGSGSSDTSIAPWFAKKLNDGNVNAIRRQAIDYGWKNMSVYDVMYYSPHIIENSVSLRKDSYYSLDAIITFRNSWNPTSNIFAGLHGGDNAASHGDLDTGNFVICVDGTYMICELGADEYNIEGYFEEHRWNYYRKRAEGQNTLVMRPAGTSWKNTTGDSNNGKVGTPDQTATSVSKVLRYESGENSAIGVVEMAPAYRYMTEGIRGMYFTDNRNTIIVQDEAKFSESMDVWWFAHTEGNITLSNDGKTAIIHRNGIYLYAELVTNVKGTKFSTMEAVSLDENYKGDSIGHPNYSGYIEYSRASFSKLCVTAKNVKEIKWAVVFKVIPTPNLAPELGKTYTLTDIKNWKLD